MNRLNLQHFLWKDQTGYLLHPSVRLSGIENPKIADLGTGTGYVHTISTNFGKGKFCEINDPKCWIYRTSPVIIHFKSHAPLSHTRYSYLNEQFW